MTVSLVEPESRLRSHFKAQEESINAALAGRDYVYLIENWDVTPIVAGLGGVGCEFTTRNRGPDVQVAPLVLLDSGLWRGWDLEKNGCRMLRRKD